ncbi:hypothetical protein OUZ56_023750 [Daphnia magna]|uniref:Uncharacterized protein n=1 Tax=Daphnia magna TaxID=35525 RepID=A0ABR0AZE1_9CRUS|nr:hypothetical protein OUZ56_023750 [Daphnia magna]
MDIIWMRRASRDETLVLVLQITIILPPHDTHYDGHYHCAPYSNLYAIICLSTDSAVFELNVILSPKPETFLRFILSLI